MVKSSAFELDVRGRIEPIAKPFDGSLHPRRSELIGFDGIGEELKRMAGSPDASAQIGAGSGPDGVVGRKAAVGVLILPDRLDGLVNRLFGCKPTASEWQLPFLPVSNRMGKPHQAVHATAWALCKILLGFELR